MNKDLATTPPSKGLPRKSEETAVQSPREKSDSSDSIPKRPFFGLVKRKEVWGLTWRGRLAALAVVAILGIVFISWIQGFLAVTEPVDSQYLVVEGWVPNYALKESIAEFRSKPYKKMFTVGADPLTGTNIEKGDSIATGAYQRLKFLGMNADLVQPVPAHIKYRNRTYHSALALKQWFADNHLTVTNFNLVTLGTHARRSRLLFQEAFGDQVNVGIIAVQNREYEPKRWWKYSEGVRQVIGESIAYIYARVIFHPGEPSNL